MREWIPVRAPSPAACILPICIPTTERAKLLPGSPPAGEHADSLRGQCGLQRLHRQGHLRVVPSLCGFSRLPVSIQVGS